MINDVKLMRYVVCRTCSAYYNNQNINNERIRIEGAWRENRCQCIFINLMRSYEVLQHGKDNGSRLYLLLLFCFTFFASAIVGGRSVPST